MRAAVRGRDAARPMTPMHAVREQRNPMANVWIFESPKNKMRLTIVGDVPFMHLVLLEGRPDVLHYSFRDDPFNLAPMPDSSGRQGYVEVAFTNGNVEWYFFSDPDGPGTEHKGKHDGIHALTVAAGERGATVSLLSHRELLENVLLFENWLTLCANITRARGVAAHRENRLLRTSFEQSPRQRVNDLLLLPGTDPALMQSCIALALQDGFLTTELKRKYFCRNSILTRSMP